MSNSEKWKKYNRKIAEKRMGENQKPPKPAKKLSYLNIQRMVPDAAEKTQRYAPEKTRDFVDFKEFGTLTLANVKLACEKFYNEPAGSCDVLFSDKGPSCSEDEQIQGKKFLLIRFIEPAQDATKNTNVSNQDVMQSRMLSDSCVESSSKRIRISKTIARKSTLISPTTTNGFPKSVSIGDVLDAGKLKKPVHEMKTELTLEYFDIRSKIWLKDTKELNIKTEKFSEGGFREAFMSYASSNGKRELYVLKKFKSETWTKVSKVYCMTLEEHTRKQIQMHMAAKAIADRFFKKIDLTKREDWFSYNDAFFATLNGEPVTVEPFVAGKFTKYINNDGVIGSHDTNKNSSKVLYEKAEALCHFSYQDSDQRLMLADLQGSGLKLYDPEIATADELEGEDLQGERFFCGGNLNDAAIDTFFRNHKCNLYCKLASLEEVEMREISDDSH